MASKLTDITASYHSFEKDQVLTEAQLNEFLNYFEDQDRLSRICLSGVGNVCGFNVDNTTDTQQVYITQGCGVSTDGDLLTLRKKGSEDGLKNIDIKGLAFTNFKVFLDENAKYPQFIKDGTQLPIWEMLTAEETTDSGSTQPLLKDLANLSDLVALLYLECYEDTSDLCEGLSCDAQGVHQVARLRVLLMSQQSADFVLQNDSLFTKHDLMSTYVQMKDVAVKRVLVTSTNAATIGTLAGSYNISNEASLLKDLKDGLILMKTKLDPYYPNNPISTIISSLNAKLPPATPSKTLYFQYRYDLLRDVVDSYNELKELFIHISTECFPSITAFPKHLFIGKLAPKEEDLLMKRYRHDFYRSPILEDDSPEYGEFVSVLQRLDEQLRAYPQLPETGYNSSLQLFDLQLRSSIIGEPQIKIKRSPGLFRSDIKITPSVYRTTLGNKAIPFYYTMSVPLMKAWNSRKTLVGKYRKNLSYNTTLLDGSRQVQEPLLYNMEPYNFLSIEGHQGHDYKEALETINKLRDKYGLSFDTKVIGIDLDTSLVIDTTNYSCEFEDLSVLLNAWVQEQECNLGSVASLISAYSLKNPGKNLKEEIYTPRTRFTFQQTPGTGVVTEDLSLSTDISPSKLSSGLKVNQTLGTLDAVVSQQQKDVIAANRSSFGSTSVVLENLTTDKSAVGYAFLQAVEGNVRGSANDFITEGNFHAQEVLQQPDALPWLPDMYVSIVDNTLQILAYSHILSNSIPTSVGGITDQVIANYNTNINNLCVNLKRVQVTLTTSTTLSEKNRGILNLLVAQLTSICCASKQLQTLLVEIDKRKDAILDRLTLKKFAEEHPGMEHLAGVQHGGTFVMVYLKKGLNVEGGISNAPNGTVVADFSLPYMCCSDCAPINFIIPKAPVQLRLETDVYCLGALPGALYFEVEPADGVIKADREIPGVSIVGKILTIDPSKIPASALDQAIHFTVNDQITNTQLKLVKPISAFFNVPESPVTNSTVSFEPIGDFPAGTKFEWNFGDGITSTERRVIHYFKLPVNDDNEVEVTLKVTPANGACPTTDKHKIKFEEVTISLPEEVFCINDTKPYSFEITPANATAVITGPGVENNEFTPKNAGDTGEIQFYLNANPALKVTINPIPSVLASGSIKEDMVSLTGTVKDQDDFAWRFESEDGHKIHGEISNELSLLLPLQEFNQEFVQPGAVFFAILYADNDCGQTESQVRLTVPADTEQCNADAKKSIEKIRTDVKKLMESSSFSKLTQAQRDFFTKSREYLEGVLNDFEAYMDGDKNSTVVSFTANMLSRLREAIIAVSHGKNELQYNLLIKLYDWVSESFFAVVQCQDEDNFHKSSLMSMMDVIASHLNPRVSTSFAVQQIDIDPEHDYLNFLGAILPYRSEGTDSYSRIKLIMDYLSNYGQGAAGAER